LTSLIKSKRGLYIYALLFSLSVGSCLFLALCTFAFGLPVLFWVTTQCLNIQALLLVEWVCLYGYSLVPFLPAVLLCIIPFGIVSWIFLSMASVVSCSLVIRNVAVPMLASDVGHAKAPPVLLAIMGSHIIFFLFLKFSFYHYKK